jgi:hypothetical protein
MDCPKLKSELLKLANPLDPNELFEDCGGHKSPVQGSVDGNTILGNFEGRPTRLLP